MKKQFVFLILLSLLLLFTGCQRDNTISITTQTADTGDSPEASVIPETHDPEITETPSASVPVETKPAANALLSHSIENGTAVTVSLGMTLGEVTALLGNAGITYSDGNHWEDTMPGDEVSGISLTESDTCEFLDFSEDGTLDYIQWVLVSGSVTDEFEDAFPGCVTSAIDTYGFLPLYYHSESGNDAVGFPLDGGYYALFHNSSSGEIIASLSCNDTYASSEPSKDYALLLSEDASYAASEGAVDLETVLADVSEKYGKTDRDGNVNTYNCEGIALYDRHLYYSIRWATVYNNEEDGDRSTYNGQIYVSLDGSTMLRGNHNEVLSD